MIRRHVQVRVRRLAVGSHAGHLAARTSEIVGRDVLTGVPAPDLTRQTAVHHLYPAAQRGIRGIHHLCKVSRRRGSQGIAQRLGRRQTTRGHTQRSPRRQRERVHHGVSTRGGRSGQGVTGLRDHLAAQLAVGQFIVRQVSSRRGQKHASVPKKNRQRNVRLKVYNRRYQIWWKEQIFFDTKKSKRSQSQSKSQSQTNQKRGLP